MESENHPSRLKGLRVLIVEDCPITRAALATLLEADGAEVVAVGSGRAALHEAERAPFDVVLTDLGLPDVPGDLVTRAVLEGAIVRPRVVAMTGFGEPHITRARDAGADAVLAKPFDWVVLKALLEPGSGPQRMIAA